MTSPIDNFKNQSFLRDAYLGGAAGVAVSPLLKAQMCLKNMAQTSSPLTLRPSVLLRGTGVFAASFAPIIAIQNVANSKFSSKMNPLLAASGAGAASAVASCLTEGILRQQEITGKNFNQTIFDMHSKGGIRVFQRGYIPTAIRESGFAGAYLGAVPIVTEELENRGFSKAKARLCAGIGSGVVAAIITHPFDTLKTQVQSDLSKEVFFRDVLKLKKDAFLGISWRITMVATATTVIPVVKEKLK